MTEDFEKPRRAHGDEPWWQTPFGRLGRFLSREIWRIEHASLNAFTAALLKVARVLVITIRGFVDDHCMMRSGALTYVTIFSLVPLLAFGFAVAKGLGADEMLRTEVIEPYLDRTFGAAAETARIEPPASTEDAETVATEEHELPEAADAGEDDEADTGQDAADDRVTAGVLMRDVTNKIFDFVDQTKFASLGIFSLVFLLYSGMKLLGAIEDALNDVWGVRNTRSFARRITNYIAIVVLTPLVLITGTTITTFLRTDALNDYVNLSPLLGLVPVLTVGLGMTYLFIALPNTKVSLVAALIGGLVGGVLWQLAQVAHVEFQVGVARFSYIYSGFAALPFFLLWIYVNWGILLFGSQLSFAIQNEPTFTQIHRTGDVDQAYREALALRLGVRVAAPFVAGREAPTATALATELGVAPRIVVQVLERLVAGRLLVRADEEAGEGYLPAREPGSITLRDVLVAMRSDAETRRPPVKRDIDARIDRHLDALDGELDGSLHNKTLRELARSLEDGETSSVEAGEVAPHATA